MLRTEEQRWCDVWDTAIHPSGTVIVHIHHDLIVQEEDVHWLPEDSGQVSHAWSHDAVSLSDAGPGQCHNVHTRNNVSSRHVSNVNVWQCYWGRSRSRLSHFKNLSRFSPTGTFEEPRHPFVKGSNFNFRWWSLVYKTIYDRFQSVYIVKHRQTPLTRLISSLSVSKEQ